MKLHVPGVCRVNDFQIFDWIRVSCQSIPVTLLCYKKVVGLE